MRGILASSFHAHSNRISSVTFSYNNQTIISSSWDKTVKIWAAETAIPKFFNISFFAGLFGKKQTKTENASSLPSFIFQEAQKNLVQAPTSSISTIDSDAYSFRWESTNIPARDPQISLEDWDQWLKEWKRKEEDRKKEQRAKERIRLTQERLKLEKHREERLRKEQKLKEEKLIRRTEKPLKLKKQGQERLIREQKPGERLKQNEEYLKLEKQRKERARSEQKLKEEKLKQEQQQENLKPKTTDFWNSILSSSSGEKTFVQGYHRRNGTYVKAHHRKQS